jgi:HPr kinase/phosphorylase
VEYTYLNSLEPEVKMKNYELFMSSRIPCVIYASRTEPDEVMIELAKKYKKPLLSSERTTSSLMAEIIRWLNVELAPCISIHGVLVDVYGEGVLIMGESGIGKSEAALELLKRGHRLITDDVVEIHKVSDDTLVGTSPEITRHFIELRGIGIIDVKTLYGVESVKETQTLDMVIKLEEWDKDKEYDRLGLNEEYTEFLGNKVICHSIPIRPGRNLAIIVEAAAVNHRQKKMGYNAAQELYRRVQESINKNKR